MSFLWVFVLCVILVEDDDIWCVVVAVFVFIVWFWIWGCILYVFGLFLGFVLYFVCVVFVGNIDLC